MSKEEINKHREVYHAIKSILVTAYGEIGTELATYDIIEALKGLKVLDLKTDWAKSNLLTPVELPEIEDDASDEWNDRKTPIEPEEVWDAQKQEEPESWAQDATTEYRERTPEKEWEEWKTGVEQLKKASELPKDVPQKNVLVQMDNAVVRIPKRLYYFGTNLREHGHYIFRLGIDNSEIDFSKLLGPESSVLPTDVLKKVHSFQMVIAEQGTVSFHSMKIQDTRWSICGIIGSPLDTRGGTCSVFFTPETVQVEDWEAILRKIPVTSRILAAMQQQFKIQF